MKRAMFRSVLVAGLLGLFVAQAPADFALAQSAADDAATKGNEALKKDEAGVPGKKIPFDIHRNSVIRPMGGNDTVVFDAKVAARHIIDDTSGNETLIFKGDKMEEVVFKPILDSAGKVDSVELDFGENHKIRLLHYFKGSSVSVRDSVSGPGCIEKIDFPDRQNLTFEDMKALLDDGDAERDMTLLPQEVMEAQRIEREALLKRQRERLARVRQAAPGTTPSTPVPGPKSVMSSPPQAATKGASSVQPRQEARNLITSTMLGGPAARTLARQSQTAPPVSADCEDDALQQWKQAVLTRLYAAFNDAKGMEKMTFRVIVQPDGRLESVSVTQGSGDKLLDAVGEARIKTAAPFPAIPTNIRAAFAFQPGQPPKPYQVKKGCVARNFTRSSPARITGRLGVDALGEPDFGPYIAELQRRIRRNWSPPKGERTKRVVAFFKIAKDGRLLSVRLQNPSGSDAYDQAALAAVRTSAPFRPLPDDFRHSSVDVQFTFDYDVYNGVGGARMR